MSKAWLSLLLLWAVGTSQASGSDADAASPAAGASRLLALLAATDRLVADFEQVVYGAQNDPMQRLTGRLSIERPGRFRWEVKAPYPQLIVANEERVYIYDEDLEQVTVEPASDALGGTPARLLAGGGDALEVMFDVVAMAPIDGTASFILSPKDTTSLYRDLRLHFRDGVLAQLDIVDHLEQVTQITFSNVDADPEFTTGFFTFTIPPGTDVIGDLVEPVRQPG